MSKFTLADLGATSVAYELKHPKTGEPLGVTIDVTGSDTVEFRELAKSQIIRSAARPAGQDLNERMADDEALLMTCIRGWSDDEFFGGPFSKEAALAIVRNPAYSWLREQVNAFTNDRKNFFR